MLRLVSFDIWGTLFKSNPEYRQLQRELIHEAIGYPSELSELRLLVREVYAELDREIEWSGLHFGMYGRISRLVQRAGLPMPSADTLVALKYELSKVHLAHPPLLTEPQIPEIFAGLQHSGIEVAVISNTNMTDGVIVHEALAHHGLAQYLDYELYSDELGFCKPDPRIFGELVQRSGIMPGSITHIGDNPVADRQGALDAGFGAILYERRRRQPESLDVIWTYSRLMSVLAIREEMSW